MENATPMLRQYLDIKKSYPDALLFFRLGDFYELFDEDAIIGSRELGITLTARQKDSARPIPMCGVPYHSASGYIAKLVKRGYRVAICEQAEPAGKTTKLVRREVVRVITPGTAIDSQLIDDREACILSAICRERDIFGLAFLDVSTGDFFATELPATGGERAVGEIIDNFAPRELLYPSDLAGFIAERFSIPLHDELFGTAAPNNPHSSLPFALTPVEGDYFDYNNSLRLLTGQFGTQSLAGFGFDGRRAATAAAAACLRYARETQKSAADHISSIRYLELAEQMVLDGLTLRNLDIFPDRGDSGRRCLLDVLDETITAMGARLLRAWISRPLVKVDEIDTRLAAVDALGDSILRSSVRSDLKDVSDLERLAGRLNLGSASPRDLIALSRSLAVIPRLRDRLASVDSDLIRLLAGKLSDLPELRNLISQSIAADPPNNVSEGGVIRDGFNPELDQLRFLAREGKQAIASFEEQERERTGIASLKIRFNNVFGYYIEVSRAQLSKVPDDYERKQTLANAERYTTRELKEWEQKVTGAEESALKLEADLFASIVDTARRATAQIQNTAKAVASLDVLANFAEVSARRRYVRPKIHDGDEMHIRGGRHPVVEVFADERFVPNDTRLNNTSDRLLIITGANMGGKSTLLRQVALIQILGQAGCFVPADSATLPIVDRIWTRVGASDDLASGRSTFMVEMTETATILHNATDRSLVILDEIGRGTSTFDGLSIAWAVAEYLHNSERHRAKTLFATHYHELTELAEHLEGARNFQMAASETDGKVVFLHKMVEGKASKSYGIAVARLAGLPTDVIKRAEEVLQRLETYELAVFGGNAENALSAAAGKNAAIQFSLFEASNRSAVEELLRVDPASLTDAECRQLLVRVRKRLM